MSYYHYYSAQSEQARHLNARARRSQRLWLWLWCIIAAGAIIFGLTLAHTAANLLIAGFLAHSHS